MGKGSSQAELIRAGREFLLAQLLTEIVSRYAKRKQGPFLLSAGVAGSADR